MVRAARLPHVYQIGRDVARIVITSLVGVDLVSAPTKNPG